MSATSDQTAVVRLVVPPKIALPDQTKIGDWKIGQWLGGGGQGEVWKASSLGTKRRSPCALKACFSDVTTERARFEREIDILQRCEKSPHILRIVDADKEWLERVPNFPRFAFYVSERGEGPLDQVFLGDGFSRLQLFREACEAARFLHELDPPVIHRDIKPSNLLIAREPRRIVLADFGIARPLETDEGITHIHELVGTEHFRAPEAATSPTSRVDVFSLGRLLEWLVTGDFSRDMRPRRVPRGDQFSDDAADAIDKIIEKATQLEPSNRYSSVREMLTAVPKLWLTIREGQPTSVPAVTTPRGPRDVMAKAAEVARDNDRARWREEEIEEKRRYVKQMLDLRPTLESMPVSNDRGGYIDFADSIIRPTISRLGFALAGVLSQKSPFEDQRRTLQDLIDIPDWNWGGRVIASQAPLAVGFFFHYVHGALCFDLRRDELALQVAQELIQVPHEPEAVPTYEHRGLAGFPKSIGGDFRFAAGLLHDAYSRYDILSLAFSDLREYQLAIASYSMFLSMLDFASSIGMIEALPEEQLRDVFIGAPPMYAWFERDLIRRAALRTFGDSLVTDRVAQLFDLEKARLIAAWPRWRKIVNRYSPDGFYDELPLGELR